MDHVSPQPFLIAATLALLIILITGAAEAQTSSVYTTTNTTTSNVTNNYTATTTLDGDNSSIASDTHATQGTPGNIFSTRDGNRSGRDRDRDRDDDVNYRDRHRYDARFPYDSTEGRNRSDVDAARQGFDDPRNPWDGRYMNDHPSNHAVDRGDRDGRSDTTRGRLNNRDFRPGAYGTHRANSRGRD